MYDSYDTYRELENDRHDSYRELESDIRIYSTVHYNVVCTVHCARQIMHRTWNFEMLHLVLSQNKKIIRQIRIFGEDHFSFWRRKVNKKIY